MEEAASDLREQLQMSIKPLRDKLQVLTERKEQFKEAADHITAQTRQTEKQIRAQFEKLHKFLLEEEESRLKALREEEKQKTQNMKDKIMSVRREIETVSKTIAETKEQLRATDTCFLLQYKTMVEKVQCRPLVEKPEMEHGALIDQAKHLGNLSFNIWRNMKKLVQFYPFILNPNTAGSELIVSEDLTSVKFGERQKLPQNPERFKDYRVIGSEEFASGTHSWDVEVGGDKYWAVGVWGSLQGRAEKRRFWGISFCADKYITFSPSDIFGEPLSVKSLQRLRVKVDVDRGTVTFSDADTNTDLHTFTGTFTEGLTPFVETKNNIPLKLLPKDITAVE